MRAVLDTNVAVSALLWGGPPERLIEAAGSGKVEIFTSEELLAEFSRVLSRPALSAKLSEKGISGEELVARYAQVARLIESAEIAPAVARDQRIRILGPSAALSLVERAIP